MTGYGRRHGTFTTYLPRLKRLGLVAEGDAGLTLTDAGQAEAGEAMQTGPRDADQVRAFWRKKLKSGEWRMLEVLINAGRAITRDELAEGTGYGRRHGTFTTYLPKLKRLGLATEQDGQLSAAEALLVGDAA